MTQPNEYLPEDAANYSSLSALSKKTQSDWEAELYGREHEQWGGLLSGMFKGLTKLGSWSLSLVGSIAQAVLQVPGQIIDDVGDGIKSIATLLLSPFAWLGTLGDQVDEFIQDLNAKLDLAVKRIDVVEILLTPGEETGGRDDCSTTSNFTEVIGTLQSFWGAIRSTGVAAALYNLSPASDRQSVGMRLTNKLPGAMRLVCCSNNTMTNYAALEIETGGHGDDVAKIVVGTGPNAVTVQTSVEMRLSPDWAYQINYNPGDPDDPDDELANTFFVFINGDEVRDLRWTDGGNLVLHGPDKRRVGIATNTKNGFLVNKGFAVTDFTYADWIGVTPK